jgi:hypothetical protein
METSNPILEIEEAAHEMNQFMVKKQKAIFRRYRLLFSFLGTFGVLSILYGFDALMDEYPIMKAHPMIPLMTGIVLLILTGSLYKRLERKLDEV